MAIQTSSRRSNSVQLSLESWAFRSSTSSAPEVDSMVISHNPDDCDTNVIRQENSLLMSLPVELLLLIASFLQPNDAACLTLSCKRATCAIGLSSWKHIGRGRECRLENRAVRQLRWKFLQALEKDLPNHHLCHFCEIFLKVSHLNHSPHSSSFKKTLDICRRTNLSKMSESYSPYNRIATKLSFCDVQSILRATCLGNNSDYSLQHLHIATPWLNSSSWRHGHFTYLMKQDERPLVHNNELYMYTCSRRWALCSAEDIRDKKYRPEFFYHMSVCRHQLLDVHEKAIQKLIRNFILETSEDNVDYSQLQPLASLPFGCPRCPIEFRYTIFNHGPNAGIELALEVGHVLGSATSLHDLEWASRGEPDWQRYSFEGKMMIPVTPFPDRSWYPPIRTEPPLSRWHLMYHRMGEIKGPEILKEPGKVLELLSPNGAVNAFDPDALRLACRQREAMRTHARKRSENSQAGQNEWQSSRWQIFSTRWSKKENS
jgi:hypothetical protein